MDILQPEREDLALLALRRSLWQLLVAGSMVAVAIDAGLLHAHVPAWWCVAWPAIALLVHYRAAWAARWTMARARPLERLGQGRARRGRTCARRCSQPVRRRGAWRGSLARQWTT